MPKKSSHAQSNNSQKSPFKLNVVIVVALIGLFGTILASIVSRNSSLKTTELIINSTRDAEFALTAYSPPQERCLGFERTNDLNGAAECYKQRILVDPNDFAALDNLARLYKLLNEYDKALWVAESMLEVADTPTEQGEAYLMTGHAYKVLGEYEKAIYYLKKGVDELPEGNYYEADLSIWLAWTYQSDNQIDMACKQFSSTLDIALRRNYEWAINHARDGLKNCP